VAVAEVEDGRVNTIQRPRRRQSMYKLQITNTATKLTRTACAAVAIGAAAAALVAAGPAQADSKSGSGPIKGCLIENDGKLETVAVGTRIGLFVCGSDGEWHFGWLVTGGIAPAHKTVGPGAAIRHGVLHPAKLQR
jgi:hypothetical protein